MSDYTSNPSRPGSPVAPLPDIMTARPAAYRFNWDPASRKPGPGSVSETTEGRADYFSATPKVEIYGTSTTNLLQDVPNEWSSSRHGFHAISTVVNNPHKRSAPPKAHAAVPSVPLADLPRVKRKDFDAYLRAVAPEWDRFQKNASSSSGSSAHVHVQTQFQASSSATTLDFDELVSPELDSPSSISQSQSSHERSQSGSPRTPRPAKKSLPPLSSIPQVFFDPNFNLGDSRTFSSVTETHPSLPLSGSRSPTTPTPTPHTDPSSLSHSLPLLEKLSHHADTLEQHLIHEIALRATPFFAALTNLQDLQAESSRCLSRIQSLRAQLLDVDTLNAKKGLEAVRREARLEGVRKVREGVKVVGGVMEMVGIARSLVGAGQWGEALTCVEELKAMWDAPAYGHGFVQGQGNGNANAMSVRRSSDGRTFTLLAPIGEDEHRIPFTPLPGPTPGSKRMADVPLAELVAFGSLPSQLEELTMEIAGSLMGEVVAVLKVDLVERVYGGEVMEGKEGVEGMEGRGKLKLKVQDQDGEQRDRLRPLVHGLIRTRSVRETMGEWRGVVLGEVKGVVRRHLATFDPEDEDPKATLKASSERPWVEEVRKMSHAQFLDLLRSIYKSFLRCIEGLQASSSVLIELLDSRLPSDYPADISVLQDNLFDILSSSAELANILSSKLLSARAEQHTKLELPEFVELFNESWSFVVRCEVICRRMIVGLRGVVVGQAKSFLQSFHQSRISQSAKLVEDEQWAPADVSAPIQRIADLLVDAAVHDPRDLVLRLTPPVSSASSCTNPNPNHLPSSNSPSPSLAPGSHTDGFNSRPSSPRSTSPRPPSPLPPHPPTSTLPSKHLKIEERPYFAVSATQSTLQLVTDYLKVIVNLSLLTTDAMGRIIEFLKAFNSRTCQVVLGAGAMRSAGLKNITAKHLALASQSLSIMIALIPYIRETFRRHLNPKQAVMLVEFDKLKRDYQEHQNEIHAKLIAIMGDRLAAHIKTLRAVQWDRPGPAGKQVNDYMELLVKETVTLHKVLSRYLASAVVEYVMSQVFAAINHRLSEEYSEIELPTPESKQRLLADAHYLNVKFSALKNVGAPTGMLETVVSEKPLIGAAVPLSPLPTNTSHSLTNNNGTNNGNGNTIYSHPHPSNISLNETPTPRVAPAKRTSIFNNDRIKGMLSRATSHTATHNNVPTVTEKALPIPVPSSPMFSPPATNNIEPTPLPPPKPASPASSRPNSRPNSPRPNSPRPSSPRPNSPSPLGGPYVNGNGNGGGGGVETGYANGLRPEDAHATITNGSAASLFTPSPVPGGSSGTLTPSNAMEDLTAAAPSTGEGADEGQEAPPPIPEKDGEGTRPSTPLPETDTGIVEEPEEMEDVRDEMDDEAGSGTGTNGVADGEPEAGTRTSGGEGGSGDVRGIGEGVGAAQGEEAEAEEEGDGAVTIAAASSGEVREVVA